MRTWLIVALLLAFTSGCATTMAEDLRRDHVDTDRDFAVFEPVAGGEKLRFEAFDGEGRLTIEGRARGAGPSFRAVRLAALEDPDGWKPTDVVRAAYVLEGGSLDRIVLGYDDEGDPFVAVRDGGEWSRVAPERFSSIRLSGPRIAGAICMTGVAILIDVATFPLQLLALIALVATGQVII